jgi:hypothetical protein
MAYLKHQYDTCLASHERCAASARSGIRLPTRLICVGTMGGPLVRLCESAKLVRETSYAALSHCWGSVQPLTLTRSSAQQLYDGVTQDELPLTFQHAVAVTRRFGVRYLWIDSL